jgi:hypothetical protein
MWCRFSRWVRRYKSIMYVANMLKDISIMIIPSRHVSTTIWIMHINMTRWHKHGKMRSIYHIGIIRLRSGQIICVSYLWVGIEGWHDDAIVIDPHPIMSHGRRRSIPQRSRKNVLTHFSVEAWTWESFRDDDQWATPWLTHTIWAWLSWSTIWSFRENQSIQFTKPDGLVLTDLVFTGGIRRWRR